MPSPMADKRITIGLVWAQFAAYHIDRCETIAQRFAGRAEVLAVEVATTSNDYPWEPSGAIAAARKVTLFPGESFESIGLLRKARAIRQALAGCDWVCIGLSYAEPATILLVLALRAAGKRVVLFNDSKEDDRPRRAMGELAKRLILSPYPAAVVGATRHIAYLRKLGFHHRPVLPGYDGVGLDRVRAQGGGTLAPEGVPFAQRNFVFVGRFVDKKNLPHLVRAYAHYREGAGEDARRLMLVGSGPLEQALRRLVADLRVDEMVDFPGFLPAEAVSRVLAGALALVLPSVEEQWGLVVNEALAFGLPVIVSREVGSRDALVRAGENGFVVSSGSIEQLSQALSDTSADETNWRRMVVASHARAWMGDTGRLADALEMLIDPTPEAAAAMEHYLAELN